LSPLPVQTFHPTKAGNLTSSWDLGVAAAGTKFFINLFDGKYYIPSTRLSGWDHSQPGFYFVTLCTSKFRPFFGKLINHKVILSPIGEIVAEEWVKTGTIRPNVRLDERVIMPDHMHMIVEITHTIDEDVETPR
jgi:hypothetical protein